MSSFKELEEFIDRDNNTDNELSEQPTRKKGNRIRNGSRQMNLKQLTKPKITYCLKKCGKSHHHVVPQMDSRLNIEVIRANIEPLNAQQVYTCCITPTMSKYQCSKQANITIILHHHLEVWMKI